MRTVLGGLLLACLVVVVLIGMTSTSYADSIVVGCKCCSWAKSWCGVICC
jgi:hypothetical protein